MDGVNVSDLRGVPVCLSAGDAVGKREWELESVGEEEEEMQVDKETVLVEHRVGAFPGGER